MDVFLSSTSLFFPPLLAITFQFSGILHGRQTPPLLPLSTLWHFTCQLLSAVAKVTSFVFCSSFCCELVSPFYFSSQRLKLPVSSFLLFFMLSPSGGLAFVQIDVQALQLGKPQFLHELRVSQQQLTQKACFNRCFFPPTLLLLDVGFILANPTIPTFTGVLGVSLAPFRFCLAP
jgi:hypothetical protein